MKPAELRASVSKTPFKPFRLKLTDGREIVCDSPEPWCVAQNGALFVVYEEGKPSHSTFTPDQIASVEPHDPNEPIQETRLMPIPEEVARHLLDVLVVPWRASWDDYDSQRHRQVVILFRKHWPKLFAAHEAAAWVKASYDPYPPIDDDDGPGTRRPPR